MGCRLFSLGYKKKLAQVVFAWHVAVSKDCPGNGGQNMGELFILPTKNLQPNWHCY